ncbi:(GlcNAc)2 ABC transporter, permease component 1 [[Actinomadura] parvosata subsp. kistnae]|uniref:Peptide ABC transporter permease n=2 Tax=Nonomuraea TaxID=83681 RepID=A0A1V0A342_9ACTN|nr:MULTISPECIES: ABC transporter permease [unclassified Nonomuraea]AQZ64572.1 peptide ABC transporter permease [Nonomuraea sp. ATCC 55076]NJP88037.1 ABC transporter permease [Nonomuraea sp. FMUSA5-5]SPL99607.1 (GlcNAc)2 ABC transporter, permease component 1 [Actinomadura parvosata subsp. kistnae]
MTLIARRLAGHLARGVVMILVVATITFFIVNNIPGDPMAARYEKLIEGGMAPQAASQAVKVLYGFQPDGTLWQQYTEYLGGLFRLDLGVSVSRPGTPVLDVLTEAAKWTVLPVLLGTLLSFLVGIILGVFAAIKRTGKLGDALAISGSLLHGIPQYVLAMLLVVIFATLIPILPAEGTVDILYEPGFNAGYIGSMAEHAVLPVVTYALSAYGGWILAMKSSVVTVLGDDFILASELRGMKRSIVFRYITRNAILPLFTLLALSLGLLLGGAVFIEKIFNYPGLGWLLIGSVQDRDYALMSGAFLLITVATILANIVADLFYTVIDPRVRSGEEAS